MASYVMFLMPGFAVLYGATFLGEAPAAIGFRRPRFWSFSAAVGGEALSRSRAEKRSGHNVQSITQRHVCRLARLERTLLKEKRQVLEAKNLRQCLNRIKAPWSPAQGHGVQRARHHGREG